MKKTAFTLTVAYMTLANPAFADSLKIPPGMWETTMTSTSPMMGTNTRTMSNCMKEEQFDPKLMMQEAEGCEVVDSNVSNNTLTYTMACDVQGGTATMEGIYEIDGNEGRGSMKMEMSFDGQTMTMENTFKAKRIGDC